MGQISMVTVLRTVYKASPVTTAPLDGAASFGAAGGCWIIQEDGSIAPYSDGLVADVF